jgi:hypothetical protein
VSSKPKKKKETANTEEIGLLELSSFSEEQEEKKPDNDNDSNIPTRGSIRSSNPNIKEIEMFERARAKAIDEYQENDRKIQELEANISLIGLDLKAVATPFMNDPYLRENLQSAKLELSSLEEENGYAKESKKIDAEEKRIALEHKKLALKEKKSASRFEYKVGAWVWDWINKPRAKRESGIQIDYTTPAILLSMLGGFALLYYFVVYTPAKGKKRGEFCTKNSDCNIGDSDHKANWYEINDNGCCNGKCKKLNTILGIPAGCPV